MRRLNSLLFIIFATIFSQASDSAAEPPTKFECRWANTPIVLDGKDDDPAWKQAQVIDHFYLPWLKSPPLAKHATRAKLLWDRENLYFFAEMRAPDGVLPAATTPESTEWKGDAFGLFFKPAKDKPGYFHFRADPFGTLCSMFLVGRDAEPPKKFPDDAAFLGEIKAQSGSGRWTIEGRIPWTDFLRAGGRPQSGETWSFALYRCNASAAAEPELSTCAPLKSRSDFHQTEEYATLTFVGPDAATARPFGIDKFVQVTTSTVVGSPDPPPPYRVRRAFPKLKINYPVAVRRQPGTNLLLVIDQPWPYGPTRIGRIKDDPDSDQIETLLKWEDVAYDIVFHPKFAENGYLYIGSNGSHASGKKHTRVTRFVMDRKPPYKLDEKSATVIISWESDGHNGGAMSFGHDGMFYVTSGDGTSDSDTNIAGQDMTRLLSKVLRIDVEHPDPGQMYSVPKDNPFVGMKDIRPETWAYGLRNPWRMTVDEKTGQIWVGQNGQDLWEQAYLVRKGENYGWSVMEGSHEFYLNRKRGPTPIVLPTVEHHHSEFRSLTGGIVYYGKKFPELQGAYIYGDYSTGKIWGIKHDGSKAIWHKELADSHLQITGFGIDANGEILICDHRGKEQGCLYTLEATPKDLPPSTFPRKLTDSGLFDSVAGHRMKPGLIPYSVNAPLWSDGAYKERWIALPGNETKIEFTRSRGWNFPDRTVLVKSFALEMEAGKPESRRWVETRFLTRQDGEWYGYSYLWNDEQNEAYLVERGGKDVEYSIRTSDGERKQKWHYPSRAECMVCHSRAANFVLGLSELQMNREQDYGGIRDNQLRVLEHLGVLRVDFAKDVKDSLRDRYKKKGLDEKLINEVMSRQSPASGQRAAANSSMLSFNPEHGQKLADPYDRKADLDLRARSYLHANCSQCHVEAGGGNAQMELELTTTRDKMRVIDVKPVHHTFGLSDAKLIAPGHPERSVLLQRMSHRGEGHMPPLATSIVDEPAMEMFREWVKEMKKE
jgi:uncharacterized repeat protein (TIGR03806 family)